MSNYSMSFTVLRSAIAVGAMLAASTSWASTTNCTGDAFSSRCALYVDASGGAGGNTASLGPEVRGGSAFPVNLSGSFLELASLARFELSGVATFGSLRNRVAVSTGTTGVSLAPHVNASANLNTYFSDRLTFIDASQAPGTLGTAYASVAITGAVSASPTDRFTTSSSHAQVTINGASVSVTALGDRANIGGIPGVITFALPVKFNAEDFTSLNVQLLTSAVASALNIPDAVYAASASANFGNTVEWLGVDRVVDANGAVVDGWSVQSATGFDYAQSYAAQAVPEPGSAGLLLLGLAVVLRARLRH